MPEKRKRKIKSIADELVRKAREAALAAVQIYNSPLITFKSELFIVVMVISWTYLLHAYFRKKKIEYRYFDQSEKKRIFHRTKAGAYKHWELERCLNDDACPVDGVSQKNLRFLIGLRHEIEHQMTKKIDAQLSAKFQACCLNFNAYIKKLFGGKQGIDRHLSFSLQFSSIKLDQQEILQAHEDLPAHIETFVKSFEDSLSDSEFEDQKYAYRVLFVPKTANRKGQADKVIEFVKADSEITKNTNADYAKVYIKETEKKKYFARQVISLMNAEGFPKFGPHQHTTLWRELDAQNPGKGYGTRLGSSWFWYDNWLEVVRKHCGDKKDQYS